MPPPKNDAGDYYLVGVNPPYEQIYSDSYLKIEGETFQMAGNTCSNGIVLNGNNSYVLINLEGKYSTLDFDIGHVDDSDMKMSTITFFIDGQEVQSIDVDPEALPQHVTLPLNNGYILKIQESCEWGPKIGLSEMVAK
ncbi:MAG: hypothetical protein LUD03_03680, partial [Firmicutes bacterium]|nr:hypothetical protein [Bacillota bacterium]